MVAQPLDPGMNDNGITELDGLKNGNQADFHYFYDKYSPSVCYFITREIGDKTDAEDITHDVFVNLWKSRETISSEYHLAMFVYRSARHRCINYRRQKKIDEKYRQKFIKPDTEEDFFAAVIEEEVHRIIIERIERLPEEQKKVIKLHLEGKTNMEIAEILNISVNTVRTHKARLRKTLRETIGHLIILVIYLKNVNI